MDVRPAPVLAHSGALYARASGVRLHQIAVICPTAVGALTGVLPDAGHASARESAVRGGVFDA